MAENLKPPSDTKHQLFLASFLATAIAAQDQAFKWFTGQDGNLLSLYSLFPNVGRVILIQIRELLIKPGYLEDTTVVRQQRMEQKAVEIFGANWADLMGWSEGYIKAASHVTAIKERLPFTLNEATFIQANLPSVL